MIIFVRKDKIISIIFRNFAEKSAKLLRLGIKKIKSFVLLSTFRNFAYVYERYLVSLSAIFAG